MTSGGRPAIPNGAPAPSWSHLSSPPSSGQPSALAPQGLSGGCSSSNARVIQTPQSAATFDPTPSANLIALHLLSRRSNPIIVNPHRPIRRRIARQTPVARVDGQKSPPKPKHIHETCTGPHPGQRRSAQHLPALLARPADRSAGVLFVVQLVPLGLVTATSPARDVNLSPRSPTAARKPISPSRPLLKDLTSAACLDETLVVVSASVGRPPMNASRAGDETLQSAAIITRQLLSTTDCRGSGGSRAGYNPRVNPRELVTNVSEEWGSRSRFAWRRSCIAWVGSRKA